MDKYPELHSSINDFKFVLELEINKATFLFI